MNDAGNGNSLDNVHQQIDPSQAGSRWKKLLAFFGPAYLVSVGYMDPGNWATDIAGGSSFGYGLLWVLLMSNFMAILLQSLSARLGIVQGRDLAQCSREVYPPAVNIILYALAEIAIAACDLAEVLGMAIGLNLLCGLPLIWGVVATVLDTFLLLYLQKLGMRKLEGFIIALIAVIGTSFLVEVFLAKPNMHEVVLGFIPEIKNKTALYLAIGIIGATVMPHNLYLHSALVQTRKINRDDKSIKKALRFNRLDSTIALNIAFFVNAAILILAGAVFFHSGHQGVATLQDAHKLLAPLLGSKLAPMLFAIALIAAGQSSTITGTLAGQIVMEGYLRLRINPAVRRLITRLLAIIPTLIVLLVAGEKAIGNLLILSQVLLSMQLAFAVIPLIHFVSDRKKMGAYVIGIRTKIAAWIVAALIVVLNMNLFAQSISDWMSATDNIFVKGLIVLLATGVAVILGITLIYPLILKRREGNINLHSTVPSTLLAGHIPKPFSRIALALDYSANDQQIMGYAMQLGNESSAFVLIHVVESVSARFIGSDALDYETRLDQDHLNEYVSLLQSRGYQATGVLGFKNRTQEIARIINENSCDLLIIGSHGHNTAKDWLFGETINSVRHMISIPVFIAR
jgi:manganese transport protein